MDTLSKAVVSHEEVVVASLSENVSTETVPAPAATVPAAETLAAEPQAVTAPTTVTVTPVEPQLVAPTAIAPAVVAPATIAPTAATIAPTAERKNVTNLARVSKLVRAPLISLFADSVVAPAVAPTTTAVAATATENASGGTATAVPAPAIATGISMAMGKSKPVPPLPPLPLARLLNRATHTIIAPGITTEIILKPNLTDTVFTSETSTSATEVVTPVANPVPTLVATPVQVAVATPVAVAATPVAATANGIKIPKPIVIPKATAVPVKRESSPAGKTNNKKPSTNANANATAAATASLMTPVGKVVTGSSRSKTSVGSVSSRSAAAVASTRATAATGKSGSSDSKKKTDSSKEAKVAAATTEENEKVVYWKGTFVSSNEVNKRPSSDTEKHATGMVYVKHDLSSGKVKVFTQWQYGKRAGMAVCANLKVPKGLDGKTIPSMQTTARGVTIAYTSTKVSDEAPLFTTKGEWSNEKGLLGIVEADKGKYQVSRTTFANLPAFTERNLLNGCSVM